MMSSLFSHNLEPAFQCITLNLEMGLFPHQIELAIAIEAVGCGPWILWLSWKMSLDLPC